MSELCLLHVSAVNEVKKYCYFYIKINLPPSQAKKAQRVSRGNNFTLSLTSALEGVGGQIQAPGALNRDRNPIHTVQEGG
jgi:hypothetical protein